MLTIRLTRKGKKNQPFFRIVVIDKRRSAKGGRAVEELGYVNPLTKKYSLEKDRILYWISKGAKPTPRIHNLLVADKVIDQPKVNLFKISKKARTQAAKAAATPAAPAPAEVKEQAPAPEVAQEATPEPKIEEKPQEPVQEVPLAPETPAT